MTEFKLYIAYDCDIWRSSDSMTTIGVFDEEGLLDYLDCDYPHYLETGERIASKEIYTVKDLIEQKVDYLYVIEVEINEILFNRS